MLDVRKTLTYVFDPRGRCNRKGLLTIMLVTLALQATAAAVVFAFEMSFQHPAIYTLKILFLWVATSAISQRLHDLGLSAWWLLAAFGVLILWSILVMLYASISYGPTALDPANATFYMCLIVIYIPILLSAIWVHTVKGETEDNKFGPVPGSNGFSGAHAKRCIVAPHENPQMLQSAP